MTESTGTVYLVGAGPGDAGLITVRGVECLKRCSVVVYDYLANEALLANVPADAERVYVGKTAGQHTMTQAEINKLLADHARDGKTVVRLKGGDPFVFGRGGEEAMYLAERRIPFEIVPGVTSAIAAPAYAGIPITQRGLNVSFHVVTGHEDPEKGDADIEWDVLARTHGTLIFMMGVSNLPKIVMELTKRGKSTETPVALVRWGTMPEQETLVSTLQNVVEEVRRQNFAPPAVTVVGPVVELRTLINWAEKKPLFNKRIAVTRPLEQSVTLMSTVRDAGADVLCTPTIRTQPRPFTPNIRRQLRELISYQWVLFTSANGVRIFFDYLMQMNRDARALTQCKVAAIGDKTAEALRGHGIIADVVPRKAVQEDLASALDVAAGDRVLIPRASAARDVLEDETTRRGAKVTVLPLYDTVADADGIAHLKRELTRGRISLVTFTSSSTFERFAESVKEEDLHRLFSDVNIASIGPVTTKRIQAAGLTVHIESPVSSSEGLASAIIKAFTKQAADENESSQVFRKGDSTKVFRKKL